MKFSNDGLTLWYGTEDAPGAAHGEILVPDSDIIIAVAPYAPGNRVVVRYRIGQGPIYSVNAVLLRTDYHQNRQYFKVSFPNLPAGTTVAYLPIFMCAGRQTPNVQVATTLPSSFRVGPSDKTYDTAPLGQNQEDRSSVPQFPCVMEYLFTMSGSLEDPLHVVGETPHGYVLAWTFDDCIVRGPKVEGKVVQIGGSLMTLQRDGSGIIAARLSIITNEGAYISSMLSGIFNIGTGGYNLVTKGMKPVIPTVRSSPMFLTAHKDYLWINRLQCIGISVLDLSMSVTKMDVYALK